MNDKARGKMAGAVLASKRFGDSLVYAREALLDAVARVEDALTRVAAAEGLPPPQVFTPDNPDPLLIWMQLRLVRETGARSANRDLFPDYVKFCGDHGVDPTAVYGPKSFANRLSALGVPTVKIRGVIHRVGIRLVD